MLSYDKREGGGGAHVLVPIENKKKVIKVEAVLVSREQQDSYMLYLVYYPIFTGVVYDTRHETREVGVTPHECDDKRKGGGARE